MDETKKRQQRLIVAGVAVTMIALVVGLVVAIYFAVRNNADGGSGSGSPGAFDARVADMVRPPPATIRNGTFTDIEGESPRVTPTSGQVTIARGLRYWHISGVADGKDAAVAVMSGADPIWAGLSVSPSINVVGLPAGLAISQRMDGLAGGRTQYRLSFRATARPTGGSRGSPAYVRLFFDDQRIPLMDRDWGGLDRSTDPIAALLSEVYAFKLPSEGGFRTVFTIFNRDGSHSSMLLRIQNGSEDATVYITDVTLTPFSV